MALLFVLPHMPIEPGLSCLGAAPRVPKGSPPKQLGKGGVFVCVVHWSTECLCPLLVPNQFLWIPSIAVALPWGSAPYRPVNQDLIDQPSRLRDPVTQEKVRGFWRDICLDFSGVLKA
eukprot:Blabericola_migrator_1__4574@NODE_242_length_10949_cov_37_670281_g204_i0_p13_GENE_NODE_242_length_10949_cov_37_670281_g204_i0NODE_242_length_10949_cov_37_670281_g204_i0_p13_ORF_typecomplete_len118_score2_60_NODE_242_length_10949_cov_37_670281_g204_i053735726